MSEFKVLRELLQENFKSLTKEVGNLFQVEIDKEKLYNLYLDSFPAGTNEIFREKREHDCSACRSFIKNIGNVVAINNGVVKTIWDFDSGSETYQPVLNALDTFVKNNVIEDVWLSSFDIIGTNQNYEELESGQVLTWSHFHVVLDKKFVNKSGRSLGDIMGEYRDTKNVFKRSLDELTLDSILTVLELIAQNSLYKGEEWKGVLQEFLKHKKEYNKLTSETSKSIYTWEESLKVGPVIGRIRNHSIGTLLIDLSNDVDLDEAVRKYEKVVAPTNYKRPNAIFTKKMLEDAQKTVTELGYIDALERRYATLDDITVNNILFSNKDSAKRISGAASIFGEMAKGLAINPKQFSKIEEISIETFINGILPTAREVEVLFENKHSSSLVSLIAPVNKDCGNMFKWANRFSWAYAGNMTDSDIRSNVKSAGGNVEGVLRFSIQWNDGGEHDSNDLDAHCIEPNRNTICFRNTKNRDTTGSLDVDITCPTKGQPAVENITWTNINKMLKGTYKFLVEGFANRGGRGGFRAEIEFNGEIYSFNYNKEVKQKEQVVVAEVTFDGVNFTIVEKLPSSSSSKDIWGINTNQFIPASIVMYSPNYWDEQNGIGHRHYFFMLKDCINSESPNGFYNEFLKEELLKHKRVFEALGSKMKVSEADDQLSGLGFSSTKRAEVVVKVKGQTERVLRIKI